MRWGGLNSSTPPCLMQAWGRHREQFDSSEEQIKEAVVVEA